MKALKTTLTSALIAGTLLLTGCQSTTDDRVQILEGYSNITTYESLEEYSAFSTLVESESTFIIVITNTSCSCTTTFLPILRDYVSENQLRVYTLELDLIKYQSDFFGLPITTGETPILGIYQDGNLKHYKSYITGNATKNKPFTDADAFATWMEERIIMPKIIYITKDELDAKFATNEKFVLYYGSSTCPDCAYVNVTCLKRYVRENAAKFVIYAIDREAEGIRLKDGVVDAATYTEFKDNYGLSNVLNTSLGYATGFVPTFQYIEANGSLPKDDMSVIKDMCVVYNDQYADVIGEHPFQITRTYFDGTRPLGYLDKVEIDNIMGLYMDDAEDMHEAWAVYHEPFLQAFFDTYIG